MIGLFWIQVTSNGKSVPIRIDDIDRVYHVGGIGGGSQIKFKTGGVPLDVDQTPAGVYTLIDAQRANYTTALGDPA